MVNDSNKNVTWKGNKLKLLGEGVRIGTEAPALHLIGAELEPITLESFGDKVLVLSVVPSIDTSTCALQSMRFNQEAVKLAGHVVVLTVSLDLPFAQSRWCEANSCDRIKFASDFKFRYFGENYGTYIVDLGLLARAVFVVDRKKVIRHVEYVTNLSAEPDYEAALMAVNAVLAEC